MISAFVKRFTGLGALFGGIGGVLYPPLMLVLGPILMDFYMRAYNALSTNGTMGYATRVGPVTEADPVDGVRYIAIALIMYGIVFGAVGAIGGSIAGVICGLVTGVVTRQWFAPVTHPILYHLVLAAISGTLALITCALVFGCILTSMGQEIFLAIPASIIATLAAVIASQRIADWYLRSYLRLTPDSAT